MEIAKKAIAQKTGARGLRSIMENVMTDLMFDLPQLSRKKQVRITKKLVLEKINKSNINTSLK